MAISSIAAQLTDYRGILHWNGYTDGAGNVRPALDVELFIKNHPIPARKPKITEAYSLSQIDSASQKETGFSGLFWGAPEPLQVALEGWLISPVSGNTWATEYGNIPYSDIVSNYLMGDYNLTSGGARQRKDPDYYITPYGHRYDKPVIAIWDPQYTVNRRKQSFTMTLYLES